MLPDLPVADYVDQIEQALTRTGWAVVKAETGAGKTTVVPLHLLRNLGPGAKILMVQPRRVAVRAAARRIADLHGESVGATVGYVTREDRRARSDSALVVMTEGVLVRRCVGDPLLTEVNTVIFDEFHERSLDADLAFAMVTFAAARRRALGLSDLRILVMSATIDAEAVATFLRQRVPVAQADAHEEPSEPGQPGQPGQPADPIISVPGRSFPVQIIWSPPKGKERIEDAIVRNIERALAHQGDVLVFLPGLGEIRGVAARLQGVTDQLGMPLDVRSLHGSMSAEDQDHALWGDRLGRKVVLSTNLAETSLTVEGIGSVVDSGQVRRMRYDAGRELNRLKLGPVSRASADQRSGRAGRLAPGVAFRCWSKMEHAARPAFSSPEICSEDLSSLVLTAAEWSARLTDSLAWPPSDQDGAEPAAGPLLEFFTEPPEKSQHRATRLLRELGAIDDTGSITDVGRSMSRLPLHPRLARMVFDASRRGDAYLACVLAAVLSDRDVLRPRQGRAPSDLRIRVRLVADPTEHHPLADLRAVRTVRAAAADLHRRIAEPDRLGTTDHSAPDELDLEQIGELVAAAFPDRIANAQGSVGRFALEGTSAWIANDDNLRFCPILAVAEADPRKKERRISLAAPLI